MERLAMSLDQIIAQREKERSPQTNSSRQGSNSTLNIRGSKGARSARQMTPYQQPSKSSLKGYDSGEAVTKREPASIKFLLSNYLSGIFIGNGGSSIRELEKLCDAAIHISNVNDTYPGTKERVAFMEGSEAAVTLAQSLMWEMIGQQTYADQSNSGPLLWNPSHAKDSPGQYDEVTVQGRITIPAAAAGTVIGRGGTVIKGLASETGVEVTLDAKEDAEYTQERVLTIVGSVAQCMNFTSRVLRRLVKNNEAQYVVAGTTYPKRFTNASSRSRDAQEEVNNNSLAAGSAFSHRGRPSAVGGSIALESELFQSNVKTTVCAETLSAFTTIELAVPDHLIGGMLGPHGATLNEIVELSGAKIVCSKRGEFIEGTNNRLVTITGAPPCAQTAHTLIIHKLRQAMEGL